jgi:hypothetical protein
MYCRGIKVKVNRWDDHIFGSKLKRHGMTTVLIKRRERRKHEDERVMKKVGTAGLVVTRNENYPQHPFASD